MVDDAQVLNRGADDLLDLPPGFRFHPTDEEIITHYLSPKILNHSFSTKAMGDVDLNKCEPWDLPSKAKMGEKEWYFFCQRDRKYPTGMRTNRATEAGYWKATGKDKEIYRGRGILVGMKKTLVFYRGRAPKGEKTNWVMHEFRLEGKSTFSHVPKTSKDEWVVCRVFHKSNGTKKVPFPMAGLARMNSFGDHLLDSPTLPPLMDPPYSFNSKSSSSYLDGDNEGDFDIKGSSNNTSNSNYFSTLVAMEDGYQSSNFSNMINHQAMMSQLNPASSSGFYPQMGQAPPPNPYFSIPGSADHMGYLHQDQAVLRALAANNDASSAVRRHCKVEQLPNQSMVSEDTGLSTDRNTEISSVVSKHEMASCGSYDDLDVPSSAGPVFDFDNMWKC